MATKTNKILGAVVAIAIIIAIMVFVYVNLPKHTETNEEDNNHQQPSTNTTLSVIFDDEQKNLTFGEIERMESYTGKGGYRNQKGFIKGVGNYTGINITTLVNLFQPVPYKYSLLITDSEGVNIPYNFSTITGHVAIYNPENPSDPNSIGTGNLTMMLAYYFEGHLLNASDDGQLKVVFVDTNGSITPSSLWWKKVVSVRIITE